MTDFSQRILIPDGVLLREVNDESILLNLEKDNFYTLNAVGTRMLQLLSSSASIQDAYEALNNEYAVDPVELRNDLSELVEQLVDQGLVICSG